jgi:hypothetical protein
MGREEGLFHVPGGYPECVRGYKMTSLAQTIDEFLRVWQKRKSGALPPVDLRVSCTSCGCQIIGDARIEYGKPGLLCEECFRKGD